MTAEDTALESPPLSIRVGFSWPMLAVLLTPGRAGQRLLNVALLSDLET